MTSMNSSTRASRYRGADMIYMRDTQLHNNSPQLGRLSVLLMMLTLMLVAFDQASATDRMDSQPSCAIASPLQCHPAGIAVLALPPSLPGETRVQTNTCSCCKGSTCVCLDKDVCQNQGDECQGACKSPKEPETK
jgi:hypothetical protein